MLGSTLCFNSVSICHILIYVMIKIYSIVILLLFFLFFLLQIESVILVLYFLITRHMHQLSLHIPPFISLSTTFLHPWYVHNCSPLSYIIYLIKNISNIFSSHRLSKKGCYIVKIFNLFGLFSKFSLYIFFKHFNICVMSV